MEKIKNIREIFDIVIPKNPKHIAYMFRNSDGYSEVTNEKFLSDVKSLAAVIATANSKCCAVIGENSYKWQVCYYAAIYADSIVVPIDNQLSEPEVATILSAAKCDMILYGATHDDLVEPYIEQNNITAYKFLADKSDKVKANSMEEAIEKGAEINDKNHELFDNIVTNTNDVMSYVFTSGTTGTSKGVMLSHQNIISNCYSAIELKVVGDRTFACLPMNHTMQSSLGCTLSLMKGTTIAINNSIKHFAENLKIFHPTDLPCVPLILETMHQNIWKAVRESGKEKTVRRIMSLSRFLMKIGIDMRKVFFKKIHDTFGGKLTTFFCGGAMVDADVAKDMYDFGFKMYIGYGITECSPLISANVFNRKFKSCGTKITCCEMKIIDPAEDGSGEICVRGHNVMLGYLDNPEATADVMDLNWFKTGDLGKFDKEGFLYITGRKKNLIVLSNGKNIYPEEIEDKINKHNEVKEVVVSANSMEVGKETTIQAEIFPNFDYLESEGIKNYEETINKIIEQVNETLPYYKRVVKVTFRMEEFEKTTTRKIKRHRL